MASIPTKDGLQPDQRYSQAPAQRLPLPATSTAPPEFSDVKVRRRTRRLIIAISVSFALCLLLFASHLHGFFSPAQDASLAQGVTSDDAPASHAESDSSAPTILDKQTGGAVPSDARGQPSAVIDGQVANAPKNDEDATGGVKFEAHFSNCPGTSAVASLAPNLPKAAFVSGGPPVTIQLWGTTSERIEKGETVATLKAEIMDCPRVMQWTVGCGITLSVDTIEDPCKESSIEMSKVGQKVGSVYMPGFACPLVPGETVAANGDITMQLEDFGALQSIPGFVPTVKKFPVRMRVEITRKRDDREILCMDAISKARN